MKIKEIKKLVSLSFVNEVLDKNKVNKYTSSLTRRDLKEYIKYLKILQLKKTLIVFTSTNAKDKSLEKDLKTKFPGKRIIFRVDKHIIGGLKIFDFDKVYDFSIKSRLENMISHMN